MGRAPYKFVKVDGGDLLTIQKVVFSKPVHVARARVGPPGPSPEVLTMVLSQPSLAAAMYTAPCR